MTLPLDFLRIFRARLREAGIRFALTSGMACVDSDAERIGRIAPPVSELWP